MKKIFYFTSTGNSQVIAQKISRAIGAELIAIPHALKHGIDNSADEIGIVFPVYMWGMPNIVVEFMKKIGSLKGKYVFGVSTYGGWQAGTMSQLKKLIEQKGGELAYGSGVRMPGNYTPMYGGPSDKKRDKTFAKADKKLSRIIDDISKKRTGTLEKNGPINNFIFSGVLYKSGMKQIKKMDKEFTVLDNCNACGICEKICPANNIKMQSGKPVWQHNCEQCLACLQWCPVEAIQFTKKTIGRKRYHHPEVRVNDILNNN
jgi:ferredoxin/flavodoxin